LALGIGLGTPAVTIDLPALPLIGRHNEENIEAAALAALVAGATPAGIRQALTDFEPLPHRVNFVREVRGVRYYNDSKATNVDAVVRALDSFAQPVVLIMGGRDKGGSYQALEAPIGRLVSQLVVLGEAAGIIGQAFRHLVPIHTAADMGAAVRMAAGLAQEGEVVLLSPACASFDMYANYQERGEDFCRHVQQLR
jgi:UDP-N-acetylmuramoylalanine--D-glutamate ligase